MSDPQRLLDDGASALEREVLGSWSHEQPSAGARRRTLAVAGLSVAAIATTSGAAAGAGVGSTLAPKAAATGLSALATSMLAGALGGALTFAALDYGGALTPRGTTSKAIASAASGSPASSAPAVSPRSEASSVPAILEATEPRDVLRHGAAERSLPPTKPRESKPAEAEPAPDGRAVDPAVAAAPEPSEKPARSELGEQVAWIDRARGALQAGESESALRLVEGYEGRFPQGMFLQEAMVLRIQALLAQNHRAAARDLARAFIAAHPKSPLAVRLGELTAAGGEGDASRPPNP